MVVVPASAGRGVAVHQQVVSPPNPPVEVLLPQSPATEAVRPGAEVLMGHQESADRQDGDGVERPHQPQGRVRGRMVHRHRAAAADAADRFAEPLAVGVGADVAGPVAQFGRPVPHRRQDQVGFRAVETPTPEDRTRLDDQHRRVAVGAALSGSEEVGTQLVAEEPMDSLHGRVRSPSARRTCGDAGGRRDDRPRRSPSLVCADRGKARARSSLHGRGPTDPRAARAPSGTDPDG